MSVVLRYTKACLSILVIAVATLANAAQSASDEKVLLGTFLFNEKGVKDQSARMAFGSAGLPKSDKEEPEEGDRYLFQLADDKDNRLASRAIRDPLIVISDEGKDRGFVPVKKASYTVRLPFDVKAHAIIVRDLKDPKQVAARLELEEIITQFCKKQEKDRECQLYLMRKRK